MVKESWKNKTDLFLKDYLKTVITKVINLKAGKGTLTLYDGTVVEGEWDQGAIIEETKVVINNKKGKVQVN